MRMFDAVKKDFVDTDKYVSVGASSKASADDVIVVFEPNRPHYELRRTYEQIYSRFFTIRT